MRRKQRPVSPGEGWAVALGSVVERKENDYFDIQYGGKKKFSYEPVKEQVAIRLTFDGHPQMTFGRISLKDDNFDDAITTMKAAAEERAGTLNAVGMRP